MPHLKSFKFKYYKKKGKPQPLCQSNKFATSGETVGAQSSTVTAQASKQQPGRCTVTEVEARLVCFLFNQDEEAAIMRKCWMCCHEILRAPPKSPTCSAVYFIGFGMKLQGITDAMKTLNPKNSSGRLGTLGCPRGWCKALVNIPFPPTHSNPMLLICSRYVVLGKSWGKQKKTSFNRESFLQLGANCSLLSFCWTL